MSFQQFGSLEIGKQGRLGESHYLYIIFGNDGCLCRVKKIFIFRIMER